MPLQHSRILVRLPREKGRSYAVIVEPGCLLRFPELIGSLAGSGTIFLITDSHVGRLYGRLLLRLFARHRSCVMIDFPAGEKSKSQAVLGMLHTAMLEAGVRRDSVVVALGGGVVGDLAGFAAATILRGVALVQVPTSLLAQVDSSVGGKVGVDHPAGKNLIGAFYQPSAVFIDPTVLQTLPKPEFRNGLAEAIKIAAALDPTFFLWLERHAPTLVPGNPGAMAGVIMRSVALKAEVVRKDERDAGVRQALNLGHTIGHALEAASGFTLKHGFAVSIGMAAEAKIARRLGYMGGRDVDRLLRLLQKLHLPTRIPFLRNRARFYGALAADKKGDVSGTKFTLPAGIGVCALGVNVGRDAIEAVMDERA